MFSDIFFPILDILIIFKACLQTDFSYRWSFN